MDLEGLRQILQDDAEWARRTGCKRKGVAAAFYEPLDGAWKTHLLTHNQPFHRVECKNIVGACGCCHAEIRCIIRAIKRPPPDSVFGTTYSPCLSCAEAILAVWPLIRRIAFLHVTEHDTRGLDLLKEAGIDIVL